MLNSQKGFASGLLVLLLLIGGIGLGTYLVQTKTNLFPKADENSLQPIPIYRLQDLAKKKHFLSRSNSTSQTTKLEGAGFFAFGLQVSDTSPVYELVSKTGSRIYSTWDQEINRLKSANWTDKGVAFYAYGVAAEKRLPVYRLASSTADYLFTTSESERDSAISQYKYKLEGIAFYVPNYVPNSDIGVSGDTTIKGMFENNPIELSTSSQYAGAINSLRWKGKEFINNWDHGRQLQSAVFADKQLFFNQDGECQNPTEAGSAADNKNSTTTSVLKLLTASGNYLISQTQMAYWLQKDNQDYGKICYNDPTRSAPYSTNLSNYFLEKKVKIGFESFPNVIEYLTKFTLPSAHQEVIFVAPTIAAKGEFSNFYVFNNLKLSGLSINDFAKVNATQMYHDNRPTIMATNDGNYAVGIYSPDLPLVDFYNVGYTNGSFSFTGDIADASMNGTGCYFNRKVTLAGSYEFKCYVIIGSLEQVKSSMLNLHNYFKDKIPVKNFSPIGAVDRVSCQDMVAWVCDPSDFSKQITMEVYKDGEKGKGGVLVSSAVAGNPRLPQVKDICGGIHPNHGFYITTPDSLKDGKSHKVYLYAQNYPINNNDPLMYSGELTCLK